jgi:hypothetical protein
VIQAASELVALLRSLAERNSTKVTAEKRALSLIAIERKLERSVARRPWAITAIASLSIGLVASFLLYARAEKARLTAADQVIRARYQRFLQQRCPSISRRNRSWSAQDAPNSRRSDKSGSED